MLVKILKTTQHMNHGDIIAGKEMDLPQGYAQALITHGYATPVIKVKNESKKDK